MPDIQPAGPNPFDVNTPVVEGLAPQGAAFEEIENEERQQLENEEREHQNQGAQINDETSDEESVTPEELFPESDDSDETSSDEDEPKRDEERERRGTHFETPDSEEYGRGKKRTAAKPSYSFLQTKFEDLEDTDKQE